MAAAMRHSGLATSHRLALTGMRPEVRRLPVGTARRSISVRAALFKQVIKDGDTLAQVASKYGLGISDLQDSSYVMVASKIKAAEAKASKKTHTQEVKPREVTVTVVAEPPARMAAPMSGNVPLSAGILGAFLSLLALGTMLHKLILGGAQAAVPATLPVGPPTTSAFAAAAIKASTAKASSAAPAAADAEQAAAAAAAPSTATPKAAAANPAVNRIEQILSQVRGTDKAAVAAAGATTSTTAAAAAQVDAPAKSAAPAAKAATKPADAKPEQPRATPAQQNASMQQQQQKRPSTPVKERSPTPVAWATTAPPQATPIQTQQQPAQQVAQQQPAQQVAQQQGAQQQSAHQQGSGLREKAQSIADKVGGMLHQLDEASHPERAAAKARAASARAASIAAAKGALLDAVYGTARGLDAPGELRSLIEEQLNQLEGLSPFRTPTQAQSVLGGRWKLVYTTNNQTLMVLNAIRALPMIDIGDVYQIIDPETLTAENKIDIAVPFLMSLTAQSGFEVRTPRQFKVRFTHVGLDTHIHTPQVLAALEVPASANVLGMEVDLTPLQAIVKPVNSGLESAHSLVNSLLAPEFQVGGQVGDRASMWLLTTYLDDTLRISRDDNGRCFVMLKDVAMPLP